ISVRSTRTSRISKGIEMKARSGIEEYGHHPQLARSIPVIKAQRSVDRIIADVPVVVVEPAGLAAVLAPELAVRCARPVEPPRRKRRRRSRQSARSLDSL